MTEPTPTDAFRVSQHQIHEALREAFGFCEDLFGEKQATPALVLEVVRLALDSHALERSRHKPDALKETIGVALEQLQRFYAGLVPPAAPLAPETELQNVEPALGEKP